MLNTLASNNAEPQAISANTGDDGLDRNSHVHNNDKISEPTSQFQNQCQYTLIQAQITGPQSNWPGGAKVRKLWNQYPRRTTSWMLK